MGRSPHKYYPRPSASLSSSLRPNTGRKHDSPSLGGKWTLQCPVLILSLLVAPGGRDKVSDCSHFTDEEKRVSQMAWTFSCYE